MMDKEVYELRMAIRREKAKQRQSVFDELDRETGKLESLRNSYGKINLKLDTTLFEDELKIPSLPSKKIPSHSNSMTR